MAAENQHFTRSKVATTFKAAGLVSSPPEIQHASQSSRVPLDPGSVPMRMARWSRRKVTVQLLGRAFCPSL